MGGRTTLTEFYRAIADMPHGTTLSGGAGGLCFHPIALEQSVTLDAPFSWMGLAHDQLVRIDGAEPVFVTSSATPTVEPHRDSAYVELMGGTTRAGNLASLVFLWVATHGDALVCIDRYQLVLPVGGYADAREVQLVTEKRPIVAPHVWAAC